MSLRARFTLLIGGLTAVVLVLFAGSFLYSEHRHLLSQVEKVQGAQADLLAHACGQARLSRDQLTVLSLFKELMKFPGFVEAMCVDARGQVTLHSSLARIGTDVWGQAIPKTLQKTSFIESGRPLWAYDTLVHEGQALSGARLVFDPRPAQKTTGEIFLETATRVGSVAAIILMVAVILSWAMARALTRPIVQLEEGARRVGGGDWSARVGEDGPGELGRLASEFNGMAEKLGVLDRMKDEFVHAVSHDLRNPLGAILASAKLLRGETFSSESQSLVEVVETAAVRLSAMVNDILDVACLQERSLQFNRTVFSLPPLLRELVRLYSPLAQETRKNIVLDIPPSLPSLKADEGKVFRVFLNLLANAMKFTRPGDSVTLSARPVTPGWVECRVSDTGPGIAPERIPTLFLAHRSRKGASADDQRRQGAGLGLSLVKALVEGHGGKISVSPTSGRGGAQFVFTVPAEVS